MAFLDICGAYTGTTGTGTLTLGSAIPTLLTPTGAGAVDATVYDYSILSGNGVDREVGYGTYTASGTTLTRNYVLSTTGSLLNLSGTSEVRMTPRAGSLGDVLGAASSTDNTLPRYHLTTGKIIQGSGIVVDDSNNVSSMGTLACGTISTSGNIELGHASDTTISRTGAGAIAVEGVAVVLSATSPTLNTITTTGNIELGHASDTTISRTGAGAIAVEGVGVALNSTSLPHTASQFEVGHASDTTVSRDSAGVIAVEGVPLYSNIPVNSQSTAYTFVLSDAQKTILHPAADTNNRTFTIPANSSVAYPVGTAITIVNEVNTVTIAITTDTLVLAGSGSTGSRTLAANGMATAVKITSTKWMISGSGLT